ncbi:MAG: PEP-CTERM sorting domain-containing protein, partial [Chthoniobacteraceae bacterium]
VFTATEQTQTFEFDAVTADSFHHYGFTNAVNNEAVLTLPGAPVAPRITSLAADEPGISVTPPGVSDDDLLQTQLADATVSGNVADEGLGGVGALTDGTFTAGAGNEAYFTPTAGASVTFDLDITLNTLGYDVSSVRGFGGWNDNGRDRQNYSLFYSVVGSDDFVFLGEVDFQAGVAAQLASTVTSIFDTSLTGVDAIRVEFREPQENLHVGYGEFDVIGFATVPEPSALLLLTGAIPLLLGRRRRH